MRFIVPKAGQNYIIIINHILQSYIFKYILLENNIFSNVYNFDNIDNSSFIILIIVLLSVDNIIERNIMYERLHSLI